MSFFSGQNLSSFAYRVFDVRLSLGNCSAINQRTLLWHNDADIK